MPLTTSRLLSCRPQAWTCLGVLRRRKRDGSAQRLQRERFDAIHTSPRERTRETATAIGRATGLDRGNRGRPRRDRFRRRLVRPSFVELNDDPLLAAMERRPRRREDAWQENHDATCRGACAGTYAGLAPHYPERAVVLVSHADVIKAAVASARVADRAIDRFDIAPASITTLVVGHWGAKLLRPERNRSLGGAASMKMVVFGLTISSSWGNGHATLWRGLGRRADAERLERHVLRRGHRPTMPVRETFTRSPAAS